MSEKQKNGDISTILPLPKYEARAKENFFDQFKNSFKASLFLCQVSFLEPVSSHWYLRVRISYTLYPLCVVGFVIACIFIRILFLSYYRIHGNIYVLSLLVQSPYVLVYFLSLFAQN